MQGWRIIVPARLLFPYPLEVLRALEYPGDRRVSEFMPTHHLYQQNERYKYTMDRLFSSRRAELIPDTNDAFMC